MALEYYVDSATGNDSRTGVQAQNPATPWATIVKAIATVDASAQACNVNITNGHSESVGAYLNLHKSYTNLVTFKPTTDPGSGVTAITLTGTGAGGALIRPYNGGDAVAIAKMRFEHFQLTAPAASMVMYFWAGTCADLSFADCTFTLTTDGQHFILFSQETVDNLHFERCTFESSVALTSNGQLLLGNGNVADVFNDLQFIDCTMDRSVLGLNLHATCKKVWIHGGTWESDAIVIHIGAQNALGYRAKHVIIENATFKTYGTSHVVYVNGDGVVVQNCVIDTGTGGDYALVTKYGTGYACINNTLHSRATGGGALIVKGVQDGFYAGNTIRQYASQEAVSIYTNDSPGGTTCKNIAVVYNKIITEGAGAAFYVTTANDEGFVFVNANQYSLQGSGEGSIIGTVPATPETHAAFAAAWVAANYDYNETLDNRGIVSRMNVFLMP
jgi:hypothetical protein